ncbi:MAG: hypothetical protein WCW46_01385, partial [Candidatus Paceibacterota bacterium]
AIEAVLADKTFGAWVNFLDTINSVEELKELREYIEANHPDKDEAFLDIYEEWLTSWPNPELTADFCKNFPLVSGRLDTPQKIRIFLRAVKFRSDYPGVNKEVMASVFEEIIRRHEVLGEKRVSFLKYRGYAFGDALRIVYHTQLQAWTLTELMLPGCKCKGVDSPNKLYLDWRTEGERKTDGERF